MTINDQVNDGTLDNGATSAIGDTTSTTAVPDSDQVAAAEALPFTGLDLDVLWIGLLLLVLGGAGVLSAEGFRPPAIDQGPDSRGVSRSQRRGRHESE
jgi:hypothetical protein